MGDSDIAAYFTAFAVLIMAGVVIAFVAALRVPRRSVRLLIGILLLAMALLSRVLSLPAALVASVLGLASIILALKTPRGT